MSGAWFKFGQSSLGSDDDGIVFNASDYFEARSESIDVEGDFVIEFGPVAFRRPPWRWSLWWRVLLGEGGYRQFLAIVSGDSVVLVEPIFLVGDECLRKVGR